MPTQPNPQDAQDTTRLSFACPRCRSPMHELELPSHKGAPLTVEHCPDCRLVWFDRFESVHLEALGWVRLLRVMEASARRPLVGTQVERPACPTCAGRLNPVQNRTRFGLFAALECRLGHGHLHSHSGLLAERGLVRPLGVAERRALAQEKLALHCLNCGGPAAAGDDDCRYCRTPLVVLDLPRLAHSLRPRSELMALSPRTLGRHLSWPCRGCGAPLDPGRDINCSRCGHMVVAHDLPDIDPLLDAAETELAELAAAEAKRLARYPSTHRRPTPQAETAPVAPSRLQVVMLRGWTPLMLLLVLAVALMIGAFSGLLEPRRPAPEALRQERLATAPGSGWIWLEAHRLIEPTDRQGHATLRQALFDVYLRQLGGEALPASLTVGQLIDGTLRHPAALADRDTRGRWNRLLARHLKPLPGGSELPQTEETANPYARWIQAAPGVWVDAQSRFQGVWALTVENTGPVSWKVRPLSVSMSVHDHENLTWRCRPAPGADPLLAPNGRLALVCVTQVAPSMQEERWRMAMIMLQGGEPPKLAWDDDLRSSSAFEAMTDRWATQAARSSARLDDFLHRHTQLRSGPGKLTPADPPLAEAPPALTLRERWEMRPPASRRQVFAGIALVAFVVFCALARLLGERRGYTMAMLFAAALSCWVGWGEGAASVLLIGTYICVSATIAFVFAFGYRNYRDIVFRRFG